MTQLKPGGRPGFMKEALHNALLFLADYSSDPFEREPKRSRVESGMQDLNSSVNIGGTLNRVRMIVTFNDESDGVNLNDSVWRRCLASYEDINP